MNILKKQSVAWIITAVMIIAAIGIGRSRSTTISATPVPGPAVVDVATGSYVYDDANVLSATEEAELRRLNEELLSRYDTVVACVTTNYGRSDLGSYAISYGDSIGLGAYDFIVVLDISGDNYWLVQGAGLVNVFSDDDCGAYAWDYMEDDFARGDYGDALISLVTALSGWYHTNNW